MRTCRKCSYKFTVRDRIGAFFNIGGKLKCSECQRIERQFMTIYRVFAYIILSFLAIVYFYRISLLDILTIKGFRMLVIGVVLFFIFDIIARIIKKSREFY